MSSNEVCIVHAANSLHKQWVKAHLTPTFRGVRFCQIESLARQYIAGRVKVDVRCMTKYGRVVVRVSALVDHRDAQHTYCSVDAKNPSHDDG